MASALGSAAVSAGNVAAAAHRTAQDMPRPLSQSLTGQAACVRRGSVAGWMPSNSAALRARIARTAGRRRRGMAGSIVKAEFVRSEAQGAGETVSLRDVASGSEGGIGDASALRDIASDEAAEGGATPELHSLAREKAKESPLHESVEDIESKAEEVAEAEAEREGSGTGSNGSHGFQDVKLPGKAGPGVKPWDTVENPLAGGKSDDNGELPTVQEIGTEIVETIKDGIEGLRWSAESVIASGTSTRKGLETVKEVIDKRLKGLSLAAEEVREIGAQAADIAKKGWGGLSEKLEVVQKEVVSLTEELQGAEKTTRASDGSERSRSQILQKLEEAEDRARAVGDKVTETARQIGEEAQNRGGKIGESAEKVIQDLQAQARNVTERANEIAQDVDQQRRKIQEDAQNTASEAGQHVQEQGGQVSEASGKIIQEAQNLSRDLQKGGEREPNSQENFAQKLQNQGNKVSASVGNVLRESEGLWRNLLGSEKKESSEKEGVSSGGDQKLTTEAGKDDSSGFDIQPENNDDEWGELRQQ